MIMTGRGEHHAGAAVFMHRPEKLLCDRRMRGTWVGSHDNQSGRGRSHQVGKYDMLSLVINV